MEKTSMKKNVMGMLWTAGAVVVGIVVAKMVNDKLLAKASATPMAVASDDEEE
jgi:hypothetical protein